MKKDYIVNLELYGSTIHTEILYVQGDSEVYPLEINLYKNKQHFDLTGKTATITFTKMSGAVVVGECEVKEAIDGTLTYDFKGNEINEEGKVRALVQIYEGDKRLSFQEFIFFVKATKDTNESIKATDEFNVLTDLIDKVNNTNALSGFEIEFED